MLDEDSQESHDTDASSVIIPNTRRPEILVYRLDESGELCRVCLQVGSIPIFGTDDISAVLTHFAGIDVKPDDCLPQHVCSQCRDLLQSAIIFRRIAQKSDETLRKNAECKSEQSSLKDSKVVELNEELTREDSVNGVYLELDSDDDDDETIRSQDIDDYVDSYMKKDSNEDLKKMASVLKKAAGPRCEVCDIELRTTELLDEHCKCHDPRDIIRCEVCQNVVTKNMYKTHLDVHKELFKQRLATKYRKVKCSICKKHVSNKYIKKHMSMHDQDKSTCSEYIICNICDKTIAMNNFQAHVKSKHSTKEQTDSKLNRKQCQICSLMIKEENYKKHMTSHAARLKKYVCEDCGKEFLYPSVFRTHLLTHKDEFKLKCQFCPYRAKHVGLLKIHVRTHTKDYSYKCATCDRAFISKSNLTAHQKVHNERQFSCSECGQKFKNERNKNGHYNRVHLGIRNYSCDICKKTYGSNSVLLAHKRRTHNIKIVSRVGRTPSYLLVQDIGVEQTSSENEASVLIS